MRRPRIDPSTRMLLEEPEPPPPLVPAGGDAFDDDDDDDDGQGPQFVELLAKTAFSGIALEGVGAVEGRSLLDAERAWPGANMPDEVVARAALFRQSAIAIADTDTVAGVVRAHAAGKEAGVRVVCGAELLLHEGALALFAADEVGWGHLCEILTDAKEGIDKDDVDHRLSRVLERAAGLWAVVVPPFHLGALGPLVDAFGERLSIAVAFHKTPEDKARLSFARAVERRYGVPIVLSARPFLVDRRDKLLHDVVTCIRQHLTLTGPSADAGQRLLPNAEARLRSRREMIAIARSRLADLRDHRPDDAIAWLERSATIAAACRFQLGQLVYDFPTYHKTEDPGALLRKATWEGAERRFPDGVPDDVRQQLEHELRLIEDMRVAPYFLTVKDIVDIARSKGILCQGRGSAANSAVCYCIGVTSIDPVRMGLLFERFLSKERGEPPDIDVDFEHERREEVIQAIYDKYGRRHAALVAEVIAYRGRSAVREVGKVHGLSETQTGAMAELMLHSSFAETTRTQLRRALISAGLDPDDRRIRQTLELARRLQGQPRHLGIHVGGFVLTERPITTLSTVEPARMEKRTVLPWDKDDIEELGLFKMDVLGLGMLTCIRKCFELLKKHEGVDLELHTIPAEDPKVYDMLCEADTIGVFQVESRAQMAMLPRLRPRCFYDIVVEVAIIRPGPIQGGMVHPYLRRRNGEEPVEMPHESLRPILQRTLGVPLFQEQVMKLAIVGAGYSAGEADQLRRDMAAWRKNGKLARHRDRLLRGFRDRGIPEEFGERLYEQIKGFGEYGFPESHAASFAILVYASAYLKCYWPAHFACALINSLPMGFYTPSQIIADAQRHGVPARPVCANQSDWDCTLEAPAEVGGHRPIRLGLRLIKGLREDVARALVDERARRGPYVDVSDAVRRLDLDKKSRFQLAKAGAFDALTPHRRAAVWAAMDKRPPLLRVLPDDEVGTALSPPPAAEVLLLDYATTGLSVDDHPMVHVRPGLARALASSSVPARLRRLPLCDTKALLEVRQGRRVLVAGLVVGRQRPGTADGTCFVTLEDEHGFSNVIVWGRDFDRWRQTVVSATFLLVEGVVERQEKVIHVIAHAVRKIEPARGAFGGGDEEARAQLDLPFSSRDFH